MATKKPATAGKETEIQILEVSRGTLDVYVLGVTPLICNRVSEKARRELLMPSPRKNAAEKQANLKHDPLREYRDSPYTAREDDAPTRILMPSTAFKGALRSVALDMPGATKAELGRLTYVEGDYVSIYGVPQMLMSVVRMADAARTPDVRTRAILPHWAAKLSITYVRPLLNEKKVATLFAASGLMRGVGDFRVEKGGGHYGQFRVAAGDDKALKALLAEGRAAQDAALAEPAMYDKETEDLYAWFVTEAKRRELRVA